MFRIGRAVLDSPYWGYRMGLRPLAHWGILWSTRDPIVPRTGLAIVLLAPPSADSDYPGQAK